MLLKNYPGGGYGNILIPCFGVFNHIEDIDYDLLPEQFIIKLTNGSSFNYVCYRKSDREIKRIRKRFKKWCKTDYYSYAREWAYKDVPNRIIVEELLRPASGNPPDDYRFFCFSGKVKAIAVDIDSVVNGVKQANYYRNIYDADWKRMLGEIEFPNKLDYDPPRPARLREMVEIAERLSEDFPAVRVDLYYFDEKIYFGELTFYHSSGYQKFAPREFAEQMGSWIKLIKYR